MPVPLALPLGVALGATFAWLDPPGREGGDRSKRAAASFGTLVLGPAAAYLEFVAPPWANLYLFDLPSAFDMVLVIAIAASPLVGERLAQLAFERRDPRWLLGSTAALLTLFAAGALLGADRIEVVTSFGAFHRGLGGAALFGHRAGAALVGAIGATAAGVALTVRALTRDGSY